MSDSEDEKTVDALRTIASETDPLLDPRWEAFASGKLSKEQESELLEFAMEHGLGRDVIEAFRPLDDEAEERITTAALVKVTATKEKAPSVIAPSSSRTRASGWMLAAAMAAAALLLLFVLPKTGDPRQELPAYAMSISGGEGSGDAMRGPDAGATDVPRFDRGASIAILLRADTPSEGQIGARAFLARGSEARAWDVPITIAEGGNVRIEGPASLLLQGVPEGEWEVIVEVGRPKALLDEKTVASAASHGGLRVLRAPIVVMGAKAP